ncbi:TIGR02285 family protein [Vogesella sp. LIG4]|uniref:TIGR02285 family protein n=1 Tax=Vogesella sp. LIG4 TaxID=1192162 RepID=UPI00081FDB75|nr:TIGR02285 family protein [Vogesella sp. LIG4]SCK21654.1 conserved hypothetical protein [Vogesella sp. LIG4]
MAHSFTTKLGTAAMAALSATVMAAPANIQLTWLQLDTAPLSFSSGPDAGQGYLDLVLKTLHPALSSLPPHVVYGNVPRVEHELQKPGNSCTLGLLPTPERQRYLLFSRPYLRMLPIGLITLKKRLPAFSPYQSAQGQVVLARLLQDGKLQAGINLSRSYGSGINNVLAPYLQQPAANIVPLSGLTHFHMLQYQRIDYLLGYPFEETYPAEHDGIARQDTAFLPLQEAGGLLPASVACHKSLFGRQIIGQVNQVLASAALRQQLRSAYEHWLSPAAIASLHDLEQREGGKR